MWYKINLFKYNIHTTLAKYRKHVRWMDWVPAEGIGIFLIQSDYTLRTFFSPDWHMIGWLTPGSAFAARSSRFVMTHNILRVFETWQQFNWAKRRRFISCMELEWVKSYEWKYNLHLFNFQLIGHLKKPLNVYSNVVCLGF